MSGPPGRPSGLVSLIAARSRGGVIGRDGGMPWHLPADLKYFKRTTMGHPMIMGRRTFESMGVLPGRRSIVVTRQPDWSADGVEVAHSLDHALALTGDESVFIVGGAQIYEQALPFADRILLTEIDIDVDGDTFFPAFDPQRWREVSREPQDGFAWVVYERQPPRTTLYAGPRVGREARQKIGASVAVRDADRLLLTRRQDNALWCLPGGGIDPGETFAEAAVREAREETGLAVEVESVLAVYTDPDKIAVYPDGHSSQTYGVCFRAHVVGGEAGRSDEVTEVAWLTADEASRVPIIPLHRPLVHAAFESPSAPTLFV
ncbi:NUDIX domain-containing protein [Calidifontibacter sp. DB0510]|uniref:Dihydrofolate reductase n=1 Tax=Metallococcus carri TaxID=1656884 RepID=A0A967EAQ2_9MICO|nr:dihydrofolate reductase [Metallococcus carri]NHN56134.1 NUDIX domain-containing protein [Metallococcus carri]NOP37409.1 NUDIX domain-containing protein [Calidifontibacter sp. DB2511S]